MQKNILILLALLLPSVSVSAREAPGNRYDKIVFGCYAKDIADFEAFVVRAKSLGATHINLTNEDLPFAKWEYDTDQMKKKIKIMNDHCFDYNRIFT